MLREAAKLAYSSALRPLDDRTVTCIDYLRTFARAPNLDAPHLFSEKIQHYKLYERDQRMPALVDKLRGKDYVADVLGQSWVTPTLWSGERVTESVLREIAPPVVLKPNHASGKIACIRQGADLRSIARRANAWLGLDYHLLHREWAYEGARRLLLIEPKIGGEGWPIDYKFWVFDGEVRLIQVDKERFARHTRQFFDRHWRRLDLAMKYPAGKEAALRPPHLLEMLAGAERLGADFRFARIDFYDTPERPLFGEITFWPEAGLGRFFPASFDAILGAQWRYPGARSGRERRSAPRRRCLGQNEDVR